MFNYAHDKLETDTIYSATTNQYTRRCCRVRKNLHKCRKPEISQREQMR